MIDRILDSWLGVCCRLFDYQADLRNPEHRRWAAAGGFVTILCGPFLGPILAAHTLGWI